MDACAERGAGTVRPGRFRGLRAESTGSQADQLDGPCVRFTYPCQLVAMPGQLRVNG